MIIRIECEHGAVENLMHEKESKLLSVHHAFFFLRKKKQPNFFMRACLVQFNMNLMMPEECERFLPVFVGFP